MRTVEEVKNAFTPVGKLDEVQKTAMLKVEVGFRELATEIVNLVPECPDRTAALRKLLEAKFTCTQAITHSKPVVQVKQAETTTQAPAATAKGEKEKVNNGKQK